MSWTEDRVETLKKMWAEGQSASQIAKELGGVTRNAVIGKVHRLGLSNRASGGTAPGPAVAPKTKEKPARSAAKPADQKKPDKAETPEEPEPVPYTHLKLPTILRDWNTWAATP